VKNTTSRRGGVGLSPRTSLSELKKGVARATPAALRRKIRRLATVP
jgi:hypothetical protein